MGLWTTLRNLLKSSTLQSDEDFKAFLESRAAFLVQKSITEYSQARANMMFSTLLSEKPFQAAYENARWLSFPAGLSMVAELLMGSIRARLNGEANQTAQRLTALARHIVARYPLPPDQEPSFWTKAVDRLEADLLRAALGTPHMAHDIATPRAREIFDSLPFHSQIKQHDFAMFRNTLAFHLTAIATELEETDLGHPAFSSSN
jgi:hypothetical protein